MKTIKKVFRKIFLSVGLLLTLLILAGLMFRLLGPAPHKPKGELVKVGDIQMHINATGPKNNKPTLIIEAGTGLSTEYYHWLSEGLQDSMRVVRYDRAGVGYSELGESPRDAETIAKELHELLEKSGESPPYILAGHSFGGPYIRVFTKLYPDEVAGLVFIDSTHPEQVERMNAAPESSFRFKSVLWTLPIAIFFADTGVLGLLESFMDPLFAGEGLPEEMNDRTRDLLLNGKCLRGYKADLQKYHANLRRAKEANNFGAIPIRVFTAVEINRASYEERGIDPDVHLKKRINLQKEYTELSSNGKQFLIDGNHQSIFTRKENADIICAEILALLKVIKD